MPLQPLQRKCTLYWRLYPSNAVSCLHKMGLSSPTQTHLHGNSHFSVPWCTCTGRDIYIYSVISILWNIYLTNQWMSKSYNKDPLVSRCMFCCNRRKQSLFENLFFMQIYDFSSLWDIHAIFFGDSFSKNR